MTTYDFHPEVKRDLDEIRRYFSDTISAAQGDHAE